MGEEKPLWFGGGRVDAFEAEQDVFWGHETEWLKDDERGGSGGDLKKPLGATQMGLIYVVRSLFCININTYKARYSLTKS